MCKKFIKTCQVYPCINTSMHTSRSPKSADRPDGLAYNKSQAGKEALPLCSQLGAYHTGPMGPTIHNRVSVRTYPNPTPGQTTQGISCSVEEHNKISQEITELLLLWKPSYPKAASYLRWKRKGGTEASHKPEGPQQLCEDRALQDGRAPCLTRLNPARRLDDQAGFKGHIPPGPNPQGVPMSPPVLLGADDIPVCVPPIWVDISPTGVHKDNETSS